MVNVVNVRRVADAIEKHEIKDLGFNMAEWHGCTGDYHTDMTGHGCGTVACIGGWADAVLRLDPRQRWSETGHALGLDVGSRRSQRRGENQEIQVRRSDRRGYAVTPEQAKTQDALRRHKKAGSRRGNKVVTVPTFTVDIYMAGDLDTARAALRRYCFDVGYCVTLTATDFVYTGGMESGIRVGLINYPRFPRTPAEFRERALDIAHHLRDALCQHSFSVVMPDETVWDSLREPQP